MPPGMGHAVPAPIPCFVPVHVCVPKADALPGMSPSRMGPNRYPRQRHGVVTDPPAFLLDTAAVVWYNFEVYVGKETFTFALDIVGIELRPYGILVTVDGGDQYIICGGPNPEMMFLNFYKKA